MPNKSTGHRRPTFVPAVLAVVLAVAGALPGAGLAVSITAPDNDSDIPGVQLPGPVAAGRLGGAIYDVVYRLSVAPGHVIVASLTGTDGTDFDLYLFDASATSVLSTTGLKTKSTGPTSTESVSWPSQLGGTYYVDLNGATDVEGDYLLTVQTVPDATGPIVSLALGGGKTTTNQFTVPVSLTASDDLSGISVMAFSSDGTTFTEWQPFQPSTTWTFPAGDGPKVLWAKVKNGIGLESAPAFASLLIDTQPPVVVGLSPQPGSSVNGLRPTFTATFNEAIHAASWTELGLVVQSATGSLVPGTYTYDVATRTGSFAPTRDLQPGALYVVTVGAVEDLAGNRVLPPGSWSMTALSPTELIASGNPKVILRGGSSRIDVTLDGAPLPAVIEADSSTSFGGLQQLPAISTDDGSNSLIVAPPSNTTYRFQYQGALGVAPAHTNVRIVVRRSVALVGRSSTTTDRARVGTTVRLTAAIGPASAGVTVSFKLYRFDTVRRRWVYAGSKGRSTDAAGRAVLDWVPLISGSWYWRVSVLPSVDFANNTSPVYRWSISR